MPSLFEQSITVARYSQSALKKLTQAIVLMGRSITYLSIGPDDYERALAPIFGETVAFEALPS